MGVSNPKKDYGANIIARTELMGNGFVKTIFHQDRLVGAAIAGTRHRTHRLPKPRHRERDDGIKT